MSLSKRVADHIKANETDLEIEIVDQNLNGAKLLRCFENGECRYVVEGETGELIGNWENDAEAYEYWENN